MSAATLEALLLAAPNHWLSTLLPPIVFASKQLLDFPTNWQQFDRGLHTAQFMPISVL